MTMALIIRAKWERGRSGLLYATSADLEDLLVVETTVDEIRKEMPRAIRNLYAERGIDVVVSPVEEPNENDQRTWVALPAATAREALLEEQYERGDNFNSPSALG